MSDTEWISEWGLAKQIAKSYYLQTGRQLDPEVFLAEIQRKFNPNHDPDDGRFTYGPGGAAGAGRATRLGLPFRAASPGTSSRPLVIAAARRVPSGNATPAGPSSSVTRQQTIPPGGRDIAVAGLRAARIAEKITKQVRTVALSYHPPVRALLHQIARGEGVDDDRARLHGFASSYDVPFNYGRFARQTKPLTQMTLGEIDALQLRMASHLENPDHSTPVGRYQFTRGTLRELKTQLELDDRQIFSAALQDRLATQRLEKRGLHDYMNGKISEGEFQRSMANEWASIEDPGSIGRTPRGQPLGSATTQIAPLIRALRRN